jgi:hypothetical protein
MTRVLAIAAALLLASAVSAQQAPPAQPPAAGTSPSVPAAAPAQTAPAPAPAQPAPTAAPAQPAPAAAAPPPSPAPARQRRLYTWGSVGTSFAYGNTYWNASLGVGYLMPRGITPNVEVSYAFGETPTVTSLRPGVIWYLPIKRIQPYVGVHYTHWFVSDDFPDQDGVGGREGVSIGRMLSLGVVYDRALDCDRDCDVWYPQVSAGVAF